MASAALALLVVASCGQVDGQVRPAVKAETTVRSAPDPTTSTSAQSEASRARQNEMKRRIAELKDRAASR